MSRTAHARPGRSPGTPNHRYPGGSNGAAWRRLYAPHWEKVPSPAERAALHEDQYRGCYPIVRTVGGFVAEIWDYDDSWSAGPRTAEDLIPGYYDWRAWEAMREPWDDDRDYYDPYDSDYGWDDRGPQPEDERWVELYVDSHEDLPVDWRDCSREYDLAEYTDDVVDPETGRPLDECEVERLWLRLAHEMNHGPFPSELPAVPELRLDIPRALEREVRRDRRRAARAA